MLNKMRIDEKYLLLSLGPWNLYKPEPGTYVWIIGELHEEYPMIELDPRNDNYILMENTPDMKSAVTTFLDYQEEAA